MTTHDNEFLRLAAEAKMRIREVPPVDLAMLQNEGARIIDVRERSEFDADHITGAVHVPREDLPAIASELLPDKASPVICYCSGGNRGALAADALQSMGYLKALSLQGGLTAFRKLESESSTGLTNDESPP